MSAGFHAVLWGVLLICARMPGCQAGLPGDSATELRQIGLSIRPATVTAPVDAPETANAALPTTPSDAAPAAPAVDAVPNQPPVALQLPTLSAPPFLGAGGLPQSVAGLDQILSPSHVTGGGPPAAGAGGSDGATSFLGIEDIGKRFVFVIDSSSSMADGPLRLAKTELLASLERLQETQQFQVIFANSSQVITLDASRAAMFRGTDVDRLEVRHQIARIQTDAGTDHHAALLVALELNPDVLYYLTDGLEPAMSAKELADIRSHNRGTRIHTIEFGSGAVTLDANGARPPNFLTKLAAQNNGRSTYRDLNQTAGR